MALWMAMNSGVEGPTKRPRMAARLKERLKKVLSGFDQR